MVHENIKKLMEGFRYDAHPMGMLVSAPSARCRTFYPDAKHVHDPQSREKQIHRLIAKMPTLAAFAYRHRMGLPYVYPDNDLSYTGNFLNMLFKMTELQLPRRTRCWSARSTCSSSCTPTTSRTARTNAMRGVGSLARRPLLGRGGGDRRRSTARCTAAPTRRCCGCSTEIGSKDNVPAFIEGGEGAGGEVKLMGFGHRVYKNYDPRAKIIKQMADEVFEVTGRNPLLDIALELERIALAGRVLRQAQALSERRLLLGPHLPGDGLPGRHVPGAVRDPAHVGLARAVAGDAATTRSRRSRGRARSTWARTSAPTSR